jgi:hypothetical protein
MADELFFDNSADVVNDWIAGVDLQATVASDTFSASDARTKFGLGYESKNKLQKIEDPLASRLKGKKGVKATAEPVFEIGHGIIEEEITSRAPTKRKASSVSQDPPIKLIASAVDDKNDSNNIDQSQLEAPRKRVKTRSKQKNIRRDKRVQEFKPVHLRPGTKEYAGRPLTQVRFTSSRI